MGSKIIGKKILITGAAGYLGSKLLEKLLEGESNELLLLDVEFKSEFKERFLNFSVTFLEVDLTKPVFLKEAIEDFKPDLIFHFAANLDRQRDFSVFEKLYKVNVQGTLNLLEALQNVSYERFLYASTSEIYGTRNPLPFTENQVPSPASPYSLTKLMAENTISTFSDIYNKPFTILRIFNFFGRNMPENTFFGQLQKYIKKNEIFHMTKGEQARDFLHIDDVIDRIMFTGDSKIINKEIINICSGKSIKLITLIEMLNNLFASQLKYRCDLNYRSNEIMEIRGDSSKLFSLGYKQIDNSLEEMLIKSMSS